MYNFVKALAHEIGHSVGINHDFVGSDTTVTRYDSKGRKCINVGGIMDYALVNENDTNTWSGCSIDDFTASMNQNPNCLTPITSDNLPQSTTVPPLTVLECQLGPAYSNLNGVHNLNLNGNF